MVKHSMSRTRMYKIWLGMLRRCENKGFEKYHNYGGRGIKVCEAWHDFFYFEEWASKNGYTQFLTIDRIDNDGNYEPSNCRWITMQEQLENKRNTIFVQFNGESIQLAKLARMHGLSWRLVYTRYKSGRKEQELIAGRYKNKKRDPNQSGTS